MPERYESDHDSSSALPRELPPLAQVPPPLHLRAHPPDETKEEAVVKAGNHGWVGGRVLVRVF